MLERKVNGKERDIKDGKGDGNVNKENDEKRKMEGNWSYVKEMDVKEKMGRDEEHVKVGRSYNRKCKRSCKEMLEGKVVEKVKKHNQLQQQ